MALVHSSGHSLYVSLGEKIRQLRKAELEPKAPGRITQEELAHKARVSVSTIQRIEADTYQPRVPTLHRLAKALGVPPIELLEASAEDDD